MIHLPALAHELGLEVTWEEIAHITSQVPVICNIVPNGNLTCVDLYQAGGVPAILKTIESTLQKDVMTCTGKTLAENLNRKIEINREIIRTMDDEQFYYEWNSSIIW